MPFRSTAQQRYMFARHPEIAHRWAGEMKDAHRKGARKHPIKAANLPSHVDKGLLSRVVRRAPKAAGPVVRQGVTRASTVGVEFEHQGVKGWGRTVEAARASWQQNRASMAKSDSWEVPMDHYEPALPRRRPNYGAGNTVGKRMSGVVTGVASPKKVQPTRVAARRASAVKMPTVQSVTTKPPIPPGMVGKRDRSYNPEANRQRRLGGAAALATGAGALLMHRGAKGVREATTLARRGLPFAPTAGRPAVILEEEGKAKRVIPVPERVRVRAKDLHERGITASRGDIGNLAGGAGLVGTGVGINRYGRSRSNRSYR